MNRVPTLTYHMPLSLVRRDFVYTLCRIRRLDHMKTFVAPMEAQLEGINAAIKTETSLLDAIENARASRMVTTCALEASTLLMICSPVLKSPPGEFRCR